MSVAGPWRTLDGSATRVCLMLGSCLAMAACDSGSAREAVNGNRPAGERVTPVAVAPAMLDSAARSIRATGTVEPIRRIGINAQLAGAVQRVAVEEGDTVQAGTILAQLDSRELEAQLASAEAALEVARRAAERATQLREAQIITAAEYERDQAAFVAARATRNQLRTRLEYATIKSPISGVVLDKRVESGDIVGTQDRLFTIGDISPLVVRVPISELDVTALKAGDEVQVELDALPGRVLDGQIRRVFPAADTASRLVPVEVALTGEATRDVRPGFLARVTFHLEPRSNVLLVPAGALVRNQNGVSVFVVRDGRASRQAVSRGETYEGRVEIVEGVAPGDLVVVSGATMLRDGAAVRVVKPPTLENAPNRAEADGAKGGAASLGAEAQ